MLMEEDLPALPLRCRADARLTQSSTRRLMPLLASYLRSCMHPLTRHSRVSILTCIALRCMRMPN